ncbi:hypothetical protein IEQ34_010547 [Dendrobium chrysotoxum]|uniref:Uncharacterized protein n=1 Tax=Dendrobium chrysotoxum TaxID=161865 RepID=A0AAV7GDN1_DENCH|nr:hypothetical protein IEQ34_010547 [Dendrobium chrysotoxum]
MMWHWSSDLQFGRMAPQRTRGGAPTALVSLIGHRQYRRCAKDVYYFLQSSVCLKQLGYSMLELVIVSIFPEMRDLIIEIHQKSHAN